MKFRFIKRHEGFFWEFFLFFSKWGKCTIFELKINLYQNLSLSVFINLFWNCTWWQTLKVGPTLLFWIFKEISYDVENGVNGALFGLKLAGRILWIGVSFCPIWKFSWVWSLVFSETQHGVRSPCGFVRDRASFLKKCFSFENGENVPKMDQK